MTEKSDTQSLSQFAQKWCKYSFYIGTFALVFVIISIFGVSLTIRHFLTLTPYNSTTVDTFQIWMCRVSMSLAFVSIFCALVGILAAISSRSSLLRAGVGIFCSLLCLLLAYTTIPAFERNRQYIYRELCVNNLTTLYKALQAYSQDNNGKYPKEDQWCSLLVEKNYVKKDILRCPGSSKGPCNYSINPYCYPKSPADRVLLFDSEPGWNKFGDLETVSIDNHHGDGCCVLFNDGHVEFITVKYPNTCWLCQLHWHGE